MNNKSTLLVYCQTTPLLQASRGLWMSAAFRNVHLIIRHRLRSNPIKACCCGCGASARPTYPASNYIWMKPSILITELQTSRTQLSCYSSLISHGERTRISSRHHQSRSLSLSAHTNSDFYRTSAKQSFGSGAYSYEARAPSSVASSLLMIMKPAELCNAKIFQIQPAPSCHGVVH